MAMVMINTAVLIMANVILPLISYKKSNKYIVTVVINRNINRHRNGNANRNGNGRVILTKPQIV